MNALAIDLVQPPAIGVDFRAQAELLSLADHGSLLSRDGEHVLFKIGIDWLLEGHIEIGLLDSACVVAGLGMPIFQV